MDRFFYRKDLFRYEINSNTLQLSLYFSEILHRKIDTITSMEELREIVGEAVQLFSFNLSSYISTFAKVFEQKYSDKASEQDFINNLDEEKFTSADFFYSDDARRDIFRLNRDKGVQLHLFNALCQINYINTILPYFLKPNNILYIRFKIIAYLTAVASLENIINSEVVKENLTLGSNIEEIIALKRQLFSHDSFLRNHIFHYKIVNVDEAIFCPQLNTLQAIIESKSGYSLTDFIALIDAEMHSISECISAITNT
ncbi:hypothetical protein HCJ39_07250 [Listeria rocourtiae]|uniref:hypothetical protein n=1 Tax=Listeria rocourtiae TaxID=647910 RepID=UPI001629F814|nr:hypothetical protein [Listeria rocourtiae]MBC1604507.1 hypothetical protein [Listeria rocourtiae]